jgi:hypothetical protein
VDENMADTAYMGSPNKEGKRRLNISGDVANIIMEQVDTLDKDKLKSIEYIRIIDSHITNFDGFDAFSALKILDINRSTVESFEKIHLNYSLTKLNIHKCNITNTNGLNKMATLDILSLYESNVDNIIFPENIKEINLSEVPKFSLILKNIPKSVQTILLENNHIESDGLKKIEYLKEYPNLKKIYLSSGYTGSEEYNLKTESAKDWLPKIIIFDHFRDDEHDDEYISETEQFK